MCRFMSQEMGEKAHFFVAMPRVFPLSVHETLREKYKTITHKFTHLSTQLFRFNNNNIELPA